MKLYLIQHAEEADRVLDAERHLSASGIRDIETIGQFLEQIVPHVPRVLHSGKHRARETAERLARHIGPEAQVEEAQGLLSRDEVEPWKERLEGENEDTAVISHMPFLSRLCSLLLTGKEDVGMIAFEKGTVACLERCEDGRWRMLWMVPPALFVR